MNENKRTLLIIGKPVVILRDVTAPQDEQAVQVPLTFSF
jgi:hypothetical protein